MASTPLLAIAACTLLGVGAGGVVGIASLHVEPARGGVAAAAHASHTYRDAVKSLDDAIASESARAALDPTSWLVQGTLASNYRSRAIVTGDTADYERAQAALDLSFRLAPAGAGPFLQRAQLHGSLHRWDLMEDDLQAVERGLPKSWQRAAAVGLRGDYALQCGRYEQARALLEQAARLDPGPARLCALAELSNTTGDFHAADSLLDHAETSCAARDYPQRAWLQFERATLVLARGDAQAAAGWIARAQEAMPGWWRSDGLAADIAARLGKGADAVAIDQRLVRATGNPLFMDALARLALARGDAAEASRWTDMAWAVYSLQLLTIPEAAGAHALDHVLDLTHDGALAVQLAEANQRMRPGGDASIQLARAYLLDQRIADARTTIESVLVSPYALPAAHRAPAAIYAAGGDSVRARVQAALANPL